MADFDGVREARQRAGAWRSRSTSRCSARRTTRGSPSHPEWFTTKPDGTIAYAENPPKKYQDIYPLNFDNDPEGLYAECLRIVRHWIAAGVRIFRVDNPHTKPVNFWQWLIAEVAQDRPRRAVPRRGVHPAGDDARAGKVGFHQSYTYFTWRNDEGRDRGVRRASSPSRRALHAAELLRQHPGHPARVPAERRPGGVRDPRRAGRDAARRPGACTPASSCTSTCRCARAARSTSTRRSTSCARATSPAPRPTAARWRRCSPGSTRSGARTRPCSSCATCTFHHVDNDDIIVFSKRDERSRRHGASSSCTLEPARRRARRPCAST